MGVDSSSGLPIYPKLEMVLTTVEHDDDADVDVTTKLAGLMSTQLQNGSTEYKVYNVDGEIGIITNPASLRLYVGRTTEFSVNTTYSSLLITDEGVAVKVYDTQYFDDKVGVKVTLQQKEKNDDGSYKKDDDGNYIYKNVADNNLLGLFYTVAGDSSRYYPRTDGTTRIKVADSVSNIKKTLTLHAENSVLPSGDDYRILVETYGSADGIYFGNLTSKSSTIELIVVNDAYGLKSTIPDNQTIVDMTTGHVLTELEEDEYGNTLVEGGRYSYDDNSLDVEIQYSSALLNPYLTVTLERRDYLGDNYYNLEYYAKQGDNQIDLADYVTPLDDSGKETTFKKVKTVTSTGTLSAIESVLQKRVEYEAIDIDTLNDISGSADKVGKMTLHYKFKENLKSGTYRLIYTLYDVANPNSTSEEYEYIGEVYSYIVIK